MDEIDSAEQFTAPLVEGVHVKLRPITPNDYGPLQALELGSDLLFRWRFRGATPSPDQWAQALWQGVLAQYLVSPQGHAAPIGVVLAYRPNFQDQHAYIAAARFASAGRSPLMVLGFGMFIQYVFTCWPFRKLYLEVPEFNYDQFASGVGKYFEVEARFRGHFFFAGRFWDQLVLAISRETWIEEGEKLLSVEKPTDIHRVRVRLPAPPGRRYR